MLGNEYSVGVFDKKNISFTLFYLIYLLINVNAKYNNFFFCRKQWINFFFHIRCRIFNSIQFHQNSILKIWRSHCLLYTTPFISYTVWHTYSTAEYNINCIKIFQIFHNYLFTIIILIQYTIVCNLLIMTN